MKKSWKCLAIYLSIGFLYCSVSLFILTFLFGTGIDSFSLSDRAYVIITKPDIILLDAWWLCLISFVLTIKVFFKKSHSQVVVFLKSYKEINLLFEKYNRFYQSKRAIKFIDASLFLWSCCLFVMLIGISPDTQDPYYSPTTYSYNPFKNAMLFGWIWLLYLTILCWKLLKARKRHLPVV